jgi:acyl-CoA thioesterase-1
MLLSCLVTVLFCAAAFPAALEPVASTPRIVALGDSLTSGQGIGKSNAYPAILQQRVNEEGLGFEVVNAGVSGATTSDGVRRVRSALAGDVRVLIVALGANDGVRGVPVAQLKANLTAVIREAQARGVAVLLCGMDALPIHGWDYTIAFHRAYTELANQFHIPLVPFVLANVIGNEALMQRDRVHPNAAGARAIADNIWPHLKRLLDEPARASGPGVTRRGA